MQRDSIVELNVGGRAFATYRSTLTRRSAYFDALFNRFGGDVGWRQPLSKPLLGCEAAQPRLQSSLDDSADEALFTFATADRLPFIDRSGVLFEHVLNHLRDPAYPVPEMCRGEFLFFGVPWPYDPIVPLDLPVSPVDEHKTTRMSRTPVAPEPALLGCRAGGILHLIQFLQCASHVLSPSAVDYEGLGMRFPAELSCTETNGLALYPASCSLPSTGSGTRPAVHFPLSKFSDAVCELTMISEKRLGLPFSEVRLVYQHRRADDDGDDGDDGDLKRPQQQIKDAFAAMQSFVGGSEPGETQSTCGGADQATAADSDSDSDRDADTDALKDSTQETKSSAMGAMDMAGHSKCSLDPPPIHRICRTFTSMESQACKYTYIHKLCTTDRSEDRDMNVYDWQFVDVYNKVYVSVEQRSLQEDSAYYTLRLPFWFSKPQQPMAICNVHYHALTLEVVAAEQDSAVKPGPAPKLTATEASDSKQVQDVQPTEHANSIDQRKSAEVSGNALLSAVASQTAGSSLSPDTRKWAQSFQIFGEHIQLQQEARVKLNDKAWDLKVPVWRTSVAGVPWQIGHQFLQPWPARQFVIVLTRGDGIYLPIRSLVLQLRNHDWIHTTGDAVLLDMAARGQPAAFNKQHQQYIYALHFGNFLNFPQLDSLMLHVRPEAADADAKLFVYSETLRTFRQMSGLAGFAHGESSCQCTNCTWLTHVRGGE